MARAGLTGGVGSKEHRGSHAGRQGRSGDRRRRSRSRGRGPGSEGLAALVDAFGPGILADDGSLDRPALAEVAFTDERARERLNGITHPRIAARTAELMASAAPGQIVVHDVPLLVELALMPAYDLVVVVDADDATRLRRLEGRGMSRDEARRRMAAQATRDSRLAAADIVLSNEGDLAGLEQQVDLLWAHLVSIEA